MLELENRVTEGRNFKGKIKSLSVMDFTLVLRVSPVTLSENGTIENVTTGKSKLTF